MNECIYSRVWHQPWGSLVDGLDFFGPVDDGPSELVCVSRPELVVFLIFTDLTVSSSTDAQASYSLKHANKISKTKVSWILTPTQNLMSKNIITSEPNESDVNIT